MTVRRGKIGITTNTLAKLWKDENVSTEVLWKKCKALDCRFEDIIEIISKQEEQNKSGLTINERDDHKTSKRLRQLLSGRMKQCM